MSKIKVPLPKSSATILQRKNDEVPSICFVLKSCPITNSSKLIMISVTYLRPNFCRLLITFENSLDPDQDRQIVGPDLDPNRLTL